MTAELDRVEAEMRARYPGAQTWRHLCQASEYGTQTIWDERSLLLGSVQARTPLGAIISGDVKADLGTGEMSVYGWPLER